MECSVLSRSPGPTHKQSHPVRQAYEFRQEQLDAETWLKTATIGDLLCAHSCPLGFRRKHAFTSTHHHHNRHSRLRSPGRPPSLTSPRSHLDDRVCSLLRRRFRHRRSDSCNRHTRARHSFHILWCQRHSSGTDRYQWSRQCRLAARGSSCLWRTPYRSFHCTGTCGLTPPCSANCGPLAHTVCWDQKHK